MVDTTQVEQAAKAGAEKVGAAVESAVQTEAATVKAAGGIGAYLKANPLVVAVAVVALLVVAYVVL